MEPLTEASGFTERLARVLACFEPPPHECSFMHIVRCTGLPRASTHRIIGQLAEIGYLEPIPTWRGYRLGARLYGLLHAHLEPERLIALAKPVLAEVAQACGVASFAARLAQGQVDLFATAAPDDPKRGHVFPGIGLRPIHACSSAKVLVAFQPEKPLRTAMLATPRERFTRQTLTGENDLIAEYTRIRREGYAVCDGEINDGVVSVAVPVDLPRLGPIYALGVIALADRLSPMHRPAVVQCLKRAAARFAAVLDPTPLATPVPESENRNEPAS